MVKSKQTVKPRARFRRESPEERRRQLGEAALRCIEKHGNAGVSLRRVAIEAGVTQGLITHHFGEIGELVIYAYGILWDRMMQSIMSEVEAAGEDPVGRLDAFIRASFSPMLFDRQVLSVWVVFWGLILHSPRMSASQSEEYDLYVGMIGDLLSAYASNQGFELGDTRLAAVAFTAMTDGLWLAWCLNPKNFLPEEGVRICHAWVNGLRQGAKI